MSKSTCGAITAVSKSEQTLISDNLLTNSPIHNKIIVIYNGTDQKQKYRYSPKMSIAFCISSRLVIDKGIGEAIAALKEFNATYKFHQLSIYW